MVIKIIRLKTGDDIICKCETYDNIIEIEDAMTFEVRGANLLLQHWSPAAIIKENRTHMKRDDVLCFFDPSESFVEYYSEIIQKMKKSLEDLMNNENTLMDEVIKDFTESNLKGNIIH